MCVYTGGGRWGRMHLCECVTVKGEVGRQCSGKEYMCVGSEGVYMGEGSVCGWDVG